MIRQLFINVLITLTPVLIYQLIMLDRLYTKNSNKSKWIIGISSGLASVFCMIYPIVSGQNYLWDLRWVPLVTSILYGGLRAGIISSTLLIGYRFYIGGGFPFTESVLETIILLLVSLILRKHFIAGNNLKKIFISIVLSSFTSILTMGLIFWYFIAIGKEGYFLSQGSLFFMFWFFSYIVGFLILNFFMNNIFENARIRDELQRSEKLNVISELAASVAHEVRNPLTVVRGFLQLSLNKADSELKRYMDTAISELDRAENIISDFLNYAKPQIDHIETIHISDKLENVINTFSSFALIRNVQFRFDCDEGLLVKGDKIKLKQALMNLVKNSIEAMPNGGFITLQSFRSNENVIIKIIDTGVGIEDEQIRRLGNPFYSTKEKGTGLGLMVTFRLIDAMNGKLEFISEVGYGTQAIITLPLVSS